MKQLLLLLFYIPQLLLAQSNWCGTPERMLGDIPSAQEQDLMQIIRNNLQNKNGDSLLIIPTVVHIIHTNGIGDISDLQVEDGIRVVNEDFRRDNADTVNGNPLFFPFAADCKIEFRLAKLDPNGDSTSGITRTDTAVYPHPEPTNANFNNVKYVVNWPPNMYFNIWLVRHISGGALGYAQYPGTAFTYGGPWETYGPTIRSYEWGTIGTSASDGRTATHEIGHCLGLYHTFLSFSTGCGAECDTTGDEVCDTPPTTPTFNCDTSNLCTNDLLGPSVFSADMPDQLENYMSYNSCQSLFTQGQKDRMRGFLTTLDTLNGLYLDDNLIATGLLQPTAITELPNNENRKLLKIVDILGRETKPKKNIPLFYIYENGVVEKRITVE
jgi:hypothetical protein